MQRTRLHVVALVRATSDDQAHTRLYHNLNARRLSIPESNRLTIVASDLSTARFGLSLSVYEVLLARTQLVIHVRRSAYYKGHRPVEPFAGSLAR